MEHWIKILTPSIAGDGWAYVADQIVRLGTIYGDKEIPRELGEKLCDGVRAERFDPVKAYEMAARKSPEVEAARGGPRLR